MFLLMFFKITSVKIFFVTAFHFANVLFPLLFFGDVGLGMLFKVCCCSERFTALLTDEWLFIFMYFLVSI